MLKHESYIPRPVNVRTDLIRPKQSVNTQPTVIYYRIHDTRFQVYTYSLSSPTSSEQYHKSGLINRLSFFKFLKSDSITFRIGPNIRQIESVNTRQMEVNISL